MRVQDLPTKRKHPPKFQDPRPVKYRKMETYNEHVRNTVINFIANTGMDLAIRSVHLRG